MSSFEKVNYSLRPNKAIERKMMVEAFNRLSLLDQLSNYRYIGMGSPYFADFTLFHKNLGINDLISIEKEESKKSRFEFNKPYSCIDIQYGTSSMVLPNLELERKKNILWLDYDDKISDFMFSDIDTFFANAMPGSMFILSVNVEESLSIVQNQANDLTATTLKESRYNELINRVGAARLPHEFVGENFNTKNLAKVSYEMVNRQINSSLITRNLSLQVKVNYRQLFNFIYKDNATILTIGGIIYDKPQKRHIDKMAFSNLEFVREKEESYKISAPNLTFREIKALDTALPDKHNVEVTGGRLKNKQLQKIPVILSDIQSYAKVYRYYPNFAEALI